MANIISDETIEYVGILAKLELSDEEKEKAKSDMGRMLDYIDMLNQLDTSNVEPMSHVFPVNNVFAEKDTLAVCSFIRARGKEKASGSPSAAKRSISGPPG